MELFDKHDGSEPAPVQDQELTRVEGKIAPYIMQFKQLVGSGEWHAEALHLFVQHESKQPIAPASCDRILRQLRQHKQLNYRVINRRQSLYQFLG